MRERLGAGDLLFPREGVPLMLSKPIGCVACVLLILLTLDLSPGGHVRSR